MVVRAVLIAWLVAGCTAGADDRVCEDPQLPDPPEILGLGPRPDFVVPGEVVIQVSDFVDRSGDPFRELEVEIRWGDELVWRGVTADPRVRQLRLADGVFTGSAATIGGLAAWQDHVVRARYTVTIADGCVAQGAWSPAVAFRTDDGSAALFDPSVVHEYRVELPPESVAAINAEAYPPGCVPYVRNYHEGTLRFAGQTFTGIGVKAKGGCGSARDLDGKASLKLNLGWDSPAVEGCPDEQRLLGLGKLTFNNMVQDPSMSHELLAYAFYREMGVPVPRAALMKLYVNDVYYGVYLNLETIDRRFLARNFVSNRGMLYEGTYWCDLYDSNALDDDTGCLTREFTPDACSGAPMPGDDPEDYTPLHAMIASLDALPPGGFFPAVADIIDMDALFAMWAVEGVLAHWDGYVYEIINNYRVYHDVGTGRWSIIPTGVDQTFQRPDFDVFAVSGRLAAQCLAEADCEAAFAATLHEAVDVFAGMNMTTLRQAWKTQLDALLVPDPGREFYQVTFDGEHAATQAFIDARAAIVLQQLAARGY